MFRKFKTKGMFKISKFRKVRKTIFEIYPYFVFHFF